MNTAPSGRRLEGTLIGSEDADDWEFVAYCKYVRIRLNIRNHSGAIASLATHLNLYMLHTQQLL